MQKRGSPERRARPVRGQQRSGGVRQLELSQALGSSLAAGHPWVFRNQVPPAFHAATGSWVQVRAGSFSGFGLWDQESQLAVRIFSRLELPDRGWVQARVGEAASLRRQMLGHDTDAFRLVYGEGDGLPGIVVDHYAGYCLLAAVSPALETIVPWVCEAVLGLDGVRGVVRRDPASPGALLVLGGEPPPADLCVREGELTLRVDLARGQKTGLFLDHRDNRRFVASHGGLGTVLNLFCYTGAFSLAALAGGARHVTSVDSAVPALAAARENFELNGHDPHAHEFVGKDAFDYLEQARLRGRSFDLVISDPPSFAKRREQQKQALKAYRKLASSCLRVTARGGLYAAASCTSQVSVEQFRQTLAEAALRVNRRLQLVHEAFHAPDHPWFIAHPEGRYLKFVVLRVLGPC